MPTSPFCSVARSPCGLNGACLSERCRSQGQGRWAAGPPAGLCRCRRDSVSGCSSDRHGPCTSEPPSGGSWGKKEGLMLRLRTARALGGGDTGAPSPRQLQASPVFAGDQGRLFHQLHDGKGLRLTSVRRTKCLRVPGAPDLK